MRQRITVEQDGAEAVKVKTKPKQPARVRRQPDLCACGMPCGVRYVKKG